MLGDDLYELVAVSQQRLRQAAIHTAFDPSEELLWSATDQGCVQASLCPGLERYSVWSSFSVGHPVVGLLPSAAGILAVSSDTVRMHTRGGVPLLRMRDPALSGTTCCDWERSAAGRVVLGLSPPQEAAPSDASPPVALVDLTAERIVATAPGGGGVTALRSAGRLLACGGRTGELILRDTRTLRAEQTIAAYAGAVACVDMKDVTVVCCGLTARRGSVYCDPLVKVFDIRQAGRALQHLPFPPGPTRLRFHPKFSSTLLVMAAQGAVMLTDVQGGGGNFKNYQVDCEGDMLCSADISSSGESLAFGDGGGFLHLWSAQATPRVNLFSTPTDLPDLHPRPPAVSLRESDSFAQVPQFPLSDELPFSAYDPTATFKVGMAPRIVDPALLEKLNQVDFVGYVVNPFFRRGAPHGEAAAALAAIRNRRMARRSERPSSADGALARLVAAGRDSVARRLPKGYRYVEIKQSVAKLKFEEFDFSYYNRTRFAGLENDMANSYCNALLQVLYFIPAVKVAVSAHVCLREFCLTCELAFIMHMLDLAEGATCQASNLLRALRQLREAVALGLVEGPDEIGAKQEQDVSKRVQSLSRFLLEQLHKEAGLAPPTATLAPSDHPTPSTSITDQCFGATLRTTTKCLKVEHAPSEREARTFHVELQYPPRLPSGMEAWPSFADILQRSLARQEDIRAWCPTCKAYQPLQQRKWPVTLPGVLVLNAGIRSAHELSFWHADAASSSSSSSPRGAVSTLSPALGRSESGKDVVSGSPQWLPLQIDLHVEQEAATVTVAQDLDGPPSSAAAAVAAIAAAKDSTATDGAKLPPSSSARYELTALIAVIQEELPSGNGDAKHQSPQHLVAHIKIPPMYQDRELPMAASPVLGSPHGAASFRAMARTNSPGAAALLAAATASAAGSPITPGRGFGLASSSGRGSSGDGVTPGSVERQSSAGWATSGSSDWVLFNDFCITPTTVQEVVSLYGQHKVPCLLFYTRLDAPPLFRAPSSSVPPIDVSASPVTPPRPLPPLISPARASPIGEALFTELVNETRQKQWRSFRPFDLPAEAPRPGLLLGLDAEFVALAPAETELREDGSASVLRPARLGLARVSVVRGEGPATGIAAIDDYIRAVEPVYDYLTRYSGLQPGELDPGQSPHCVVTLKKAYLKLRYLVDCGCRFVGHGLKKDFRMINLVIPPHQIIDTVELFCLKRQRKISLRFLASYLLKLDIQKETHDSIEDSRTALRLYAMYKQLVADGEFQDKLLEIYKYGRKFGWEVGPAGTIERTLESEVPQRIH